MVLIFRARGDTGRGFKAKVWSNLDAAVLVRPTLPTTTHRPTVTWWPTLLRSTAIFGTTVSSTLFATTKAPHCDCGEWSEWTAPCSQECGGCGKRIRRRKCASDNCHDEDKRACNYHVCPPGTNFLINNGEFHILWKGCCVGLFRSGNECSALDDEQNPFLKILSSLLTSQDALKNETFSMYSVHSERES
uniref:Uncharacterized protein n=1 Tax=Parascaris equorum TaxID=6256 RepID=A0A914RTX4_PAREQ